MTTRLRSLTAVLAGCLLAVLTLVGCDSNVGTAAKVGDQRISESEVSTYLTAQSTPFVKNGQYVQPKPVILTYLIQQALAQQLLAATPGGVPTQAQLEQVEQQLLSQGGATRETLHAMYTDANFTASAAELALRASALLSVLQDRLGSGSGQLPHRNIPVYVDPRYGSWNPNALSVSTSGVGNLPFLNLQSSYTPVVTPP